MRCKDHFAAADPQHNHDGDAQQRLQRGPEHAHQPHQLQTAPDVLRVVALEAFDLGFFLHIGANQARPGEVFLRPRRDVGEHRLDALEALVDPAAEVLDHDAEDRQRREGKERQPGLMLNMKTSAPMVNTMVFAVYMMPGPASMRTAFRSLVARAMMSPVRVRW